MDVLQALHSDEAEVKIKLGEGLAPEVAMFNAVLYKIDSVIAQRNETRDMQTHY